MQTRPVLTLASFHLIVIAAAIMITAGFGIWCLINGAYLAGILSLIAGALLVVYGAYFAGKAKQAHLG